MLAPRDRIIVALDGLDRQQAVEAIDELAPHVGLFKVGFELIAKQEAGYIAAVAAKRGSRVFWDNKFKDIPNTVSLASRVVAAMPEVSMFNVHCTGGRKMMMAAVEAAEQVRSGDPNHPLVLGVTLLTSLDYDALVEVGMMSGLGKIHRKAAAVIEAVQQRRIEARVVKLALLAKACGLDGVVSSPKEIRALRKACGPDFKIVTPGIRAMDAPPDDQARTMTAREAILAGADYLVIGRPILKPRLGTRVDAAKRFATEIAMANVA